MNTLIALCIAPCGTGDEYAADVAEIVDIIRRSGLKSRTNSMFTEIEGEWDEEGIRTEVIMKADIRPGHTNMMTRKVAAVEDILKK